MMFKAGDAVRAKPGKHISTEGKCFDVEEGKTYCVETARPLSLDLVNGPDGLIPERFELVDAPVTQSAFKAGDTIRCIRPMAGHLTIGEVYEVHPKVPITPARHVYIVKDDRASITGPIEYHADRFELVKPQAEDAAKADPMALLREAAKMANPKEAMRFNSGKPKLSMIPRSALVAEANVFAFGAEKYARDNWRKGMKWTEVADSALRHLQAWLEGETNDAESGLPHLAHAKCNLSFLIEFAEKNLGTDDRYKGVTNVS